MRTLFTLMSSMEFEGACFSNQNEKKMIAEVLR